MNEKKEKERPAEREREREEEKKKSRKKYLKETKSSKEYFFFAFSLLFDLYQEAKSVRNEIGQS